MDALLAASKIPTLPQHLRRIQQSNFYGQKSGFAALGFGEFAVDIQLVFARKNHKLLLLYRDYFNCIPLIVIQNRLVSARVFKRLSFFDFDGQLNGFGPIEFQFELRHIGLFGAQDEAEKLARRFIFEGKGGKKWLARLTNFLEVFELVRIDAGQGQVVAVGFFQMEFGG